MRKQKYYIKQDFKEHLNTIPYIKDKVIYLETLLKERNEIKNKLKPVELLASLVINGNAEIEELKVDLQEVSKIAEEQLGDIKTELLFWKDVMLKTSSPEQDNGKTNGELHHKQKKSSVEIEKIKWQGTEAQLVYLFKLLFNDSFLLGTDNFQKHKLIESHFVNKEGKPFNAEQLARTLRNIGGNKKNKSKPIGAEKLEQRISEIKKLPTTTKKPKMKKFVNPKEE